MCFSCELMTSGKLLEDYVPENSLFYLKRLCLYSLVIIQCFDTGMMT